MQSGALVNTGSRLCANLEQYGAREGIPVQLGDCRRGRVEWDMVDVGPNEIAFVNRATGLVMDVQDGSRDDGARVQQWSWNSSGAQRWRMESVRGAFRIVNVQSGKCLEVQGRGVSPGAVIGQYRCVGEDHQLWRIDPSSGNIGARPPMPPSGGYPPPSIGGDGRPAGRTLYTGMIHSRLTGKCVDVADASTADGADIRQWSCNGTGAQLWDVVDLGRNEVAFVSRASNKVMEVTGRTQQSGADVVQNRWTGGANQRWRMETVGGGFSSIISVGSRKCLDLSGASQADGTNIGQYDCHYKENQQWRVEIRGSGGNWDGYRPEHNWAAPNRPYQQEPPAFMVGDFSGFDNFYQSNLQLSIHSDGVVVATLEGGQRVMGYYRGNQIFLGNSRYDVEQEHRGFRLRPSGQPGNAVSYHRVRYDSPGRPR